MKFIVTVDTEADNQWKPVAGHLPVENLRALPRFQALCASHGFPPTYLCTYEVASAASFTASLRAWDESGEAEVGAHLHPWSTPPSSQWDLTVRGSAYPSELPAEVFTEKLDALTRRVAEALGHRPSSYRAGRWGFSATNVADLLAQGYIVDCSVTPLVKWTDAGAIGGGPDFRAAPHRPYFVDRDDAAREGDSDLLEVPMTVLHTNPLARRWPAISELQQRHRRNRIARVIDGAFDVSPQWLRPFPRMTVARLQRVVDTARALQLPVIELMLHSSELLPGGSPYNRTAADVDDVFDRLDGLFRYLRSLEVTGCTLSAYAREFASTTRRARVPTQ
jgi:hypothetical protein